MDRVRFEITTDETGLESYKLPLDSLQCRRILGGRNLVRVGNVVIAAVFDFMTVEDCGG